MAAVEEAEQLVDIISGLDRNGAPKWGDCRLLLTEHQHPVNFTNGRAQVEPAIAKIVRDLNRADLMVVDRLGLITEDVPEPVKQEAPAPVDLTDEERKAHEALKSAKPQRTPEETDRLRELQRQQLVAEGDPNVPPFPIPTGYATHTAEDEHRCLAAKGDGGQCTNAAKDNGWACGFANHQQQISSLSTVPVG
jgi:hypothetical protein